MDDSKKQSYEDIVRKQYRNRIDILKRLGTDKVEPTTFGNNRAERRARRTVYRTTPSGRGYNPNRTLTPHYQRKRRTLARERALA